MTHGLAASGRLFHALADRMAGMDQNPYRSPQSPANDRPTIPAWRYVACTLLIVLGLNFCVAIPITVVEGLFFSGFDFLSVIVATIISATGVAAIWFGFRILRRRSAAEPRRLD
jgi:hypothetical protein